MAKAGEPADQIIVDLLAGRRFAHDEPLVGKVGPAEFHLTGKGVVFGQCHEDPLGPQRFRIAFGSFFRSGDECNVKVQLPDRGNMLRLVALNEVETDGRMLPFEGFQQVSQKPGPQRGEHADPNPSFVALANGGNALCTVIDRSEGSARGYQKPLPGKGQAHTTAMAMEQRGSKLIFKAPDATADRRLVDPKRDTGLAEASMFSSCNKIPDVA